MAVKQLREFLDQQKIKYELISHSPAYTAQEIAAQTHIPGKALAKTVIIRVDEKLAMMVLAASSLIDIEHLKFELGALEVDLASESEFKRRFPDCETGAMPPFGNLYGMEVYVDQALTRDPVIAFNAGSHRELMKVRYEDFARLVGPKVLKLSTSVFA